MKRRIIGGVIVAHLILIGVLAISTRQPPTTAPSPPPIKVRTVQLKPPPPVPVRVTAAPQKRIAKPKPKKHATREKKQPLAMQAQQRIQAIEQVKEAPPRATLSTVGQLQIDKLKTTPVDNTDYAQELARRLQLALQLPEYGSVRVALTVQRDGQIASVTVLEAHNRRNEDYVLTALPTLRLPPFGNYFGGEQSHSFNLTLRNDA